MKKTPITTVCRGCGKEFTYTPRYAMHRRTSCSQKCGRLIQRNGYSRRPVYTGGD